MLGLPKAQSGNFYNLSCGPFLNAKRPKRMHEICEEIAGDALEDEK